MAGCPGREIHLINVQSPIDAPELLSHMPMREIEAMQQTRGGDALVSARELLDKAGLTIPAERWYNNLPIRGNTGAASIFIILEELFNGGRLRSGQRLLCYVPESGRFSSAFMHLTVVGDEA